MQDINTVEHHHQLSLFHYYSKGGAEASHECLTQSINDSALCIFEDSDDEPAPSCQPYRKRLGMVALKN